MAAFPWQLLPGLAPPFAGLFVEIGGRSNWVAVGGLFDTGASITSLRAPVEQPRLGIRDDECIPSPVTDASGNSTWQPLTVVKARLDGHEFLIPIVLSAGLPINLIGRVGFMDLWNVRLDPSTATTQFDWIGPQPAWLNKPWGDHWMDYLQDMLLLNYSWSNWNLQGRPPIPNAPALPPALP